MLLVIIGLLLMVIGAAIVYFNIPYSKTKTEFADDAKNLLAMTTSKKGGVFTFNEIGEALAFTTDDREAVTSDGRSEKVRWSAILRDYQENGGIKKPTVLQAVWHYDEGDLIYFSSRDVVIEYDCPTGEVK